MTETETELNPALKNLPKYISVIYIISFYVSVF